MSVRILLLLSLLLTQTFLKAQDDEEPYSKETVAGIDFNTNSGIIGGFMFRHMVRINDNRFKLFSVEICNVKHPKELKTTSQASGNSFILYKENYLLALRPQYGRSFVLFHRSPEEGIQVNGLLQGGITIGIIKPYMIEYDYGGYTAIEQFDITKHQERNILGNAGFFTGFSQSKILPALSFRPSLCFEFGHYNNNVSGLEVGALFEAFPKKIIIIPLAKNQSFYSSIFVNIFFGRRY